MSFHKFRGIWFKTTILEEGMTFSEGLTKAHTLLGDADIKAVLPYERVNIVRKAI
jgi:hypothetical protein